MAPDSVARSGIHRQDRGRATDARITDLVTKEPPGSSKTNWENIQEGFLKEAALMPTGMVPTTGRGVKVKCNWEQRTKMETV